MRYIIGWLTTPFEQSLLCYNCIRYLTIYKIVYSHTIQIHSSNAVIIRFITTVFASKQMHLLIAVSLFQCVHNKGNTDLYSEDLP